jgi:nitrogen regulatory protein PII
MKRIEAVVSPFKLDDLHDVLKGAGINGMTISEVRALLPQGNVQTYRGVQYLVDYSPKIKVEVVVSDAQLDAVLAVLEVAARMGQLGDGTIMVSPVEEVIRIRTGERGGYAIDRGPLRNSRAA